MAKEHVVKEAEIIEEQEDKVITTRAKKQISITPTTLAIIVLFIAVLALFAYTTTKQDKIDHNHPMPMRGSINGDMHFGGDSYKLRNR